MAGEGKDPGKEEARNTGKGSQPKKRERPETRVWVWRRKEEHAPWQRCFAVLEEAELRTYKDEKEADVLETVQLPGSSVKDVSSSSREEVQSMRQINGKVPKRHHNKAITIWTRESQVQGQLPVSIPERRLRAAGDAEKRVEICFAVEKAEDHMPFLSRVQGAASNVRKPDAEPASRDGMAAIDGETYKASLRADTKSNTGASWDASLFLPSGGVIARLCASGLLQSRQLLEALCATRSVFSQGVHNLGEVSTEFERGQEALSKLWDHLEGMQKAIAGHCQDSLDDESKGALDDARAWVEQLRQWVHRRQMDAVGIQPGQPLVFVGGWHAFAETTIVQLQDIEQAMHLGELAALQLRQQKECSSSGSSPSRKRCFTIPRSVLPYNAYWRTKIAI